MITSHPDRVNYTKKEWNTIKTINRRIHFHNKNNGTNYTLHYEPYDVKFAEYEGIWLIVDFGKQTTIKAEESLEILVRKLSTKKLLFRAKLIQIIILRP